VAAKSSRAAPRGAPRLRCPTCAATYSVAAVFDHCEVSWPNQRWLGFDCPRCDQFSHVEVEDGRVSIGGIDGAPGPAFVPDNSARVPGLTCVFPTAGITLRLGTRVWRVRAKG